MRKSFTPFILSIPHIFSLIFCCLVNQVYGQLAFDHLSVNNGLSQSTVLSICKDSRGYMWFGTRDCLNRYDGKQVKIYHNDPKNPHSISTDDYIYALAEDRERNLWVGTQNGLNRYIPEKDAFERISYNAKDPGGISNNSILSIYADRKGRVWFGTDLGLNVLEKGSSRVFKKIYKQNGLAGNSIYAILEDRKGNIWVGTTTGLSQISIRNGQYQIRSFYRQPGDASSLSGNSIRTIAEDEKGRIWIGTEADGISLFLPETSTFQRFRYSALQPDGLSNDIIRKIMPDTKGNLWIATMNGLNVLDTEHFRFSLYQHDPDNRKSLSDNSIKMIYQDDKGSIWMGTMFGGVNVTHRNTIPFTVLKYSKYRNSISSDISSVIEGDQDHNLWIGTEGQGLNFYNTHTGLFKKYVNNPRDPGSLSNNTIKAIFKDSKNRIWIGLYQGGLEQFIPSTGEFKHYPPGVKGPSQGYISSIHEDDQGRLLLGTSSKGLNIFDPERESFQVINDEPGKGLKLSSSYIRFAYQDTKKNLWVGTPKGLNLLRPGAKQFEVFLKAETQKGSLSANQVTCIWEDRAGNIWLGTLRGGLNRYLPASKSFVSYTLTDGLASNNIIDILDDNEGNLWISTDRGLSKFDPKRKVFKNYNTGDGLPTNEFNVNSAYKDYQGKLYFGSYDGLVVFTPQEITENTFLPRTVFAGLKLFNKPVTIDGEDGLLKQDISLTRSITFAADQNIFTFDFVALNYIQPQRNRYAYQLEGFEKDWNYVSNPSATYTNLPSGKYKLMVKGSNNDGLWSKEPTIMEIRILPPLWQTWWAYLLYIAAGSTLLYFVLRFTRRQQKLESELYYEHLNSERQQELYQLKLDFFTRISHEIRTPLTLIFAPLEKLIKITTENNAVSDQLHNIKRNTDRLVRLISELLDFRKIESGNTSLKVVENDLVPFCKTIYQSYLELAETRNIAYQFNCEVDSLMVYFDPGQLEKVLYNILSNAFKFTPDNGKITFNLKQSATQAVIQVTDNGIGIPADMQDKIFTNFFQAKTGHVAAEGWGIGLALAKNILDLHHGEITVYSKPANGDLNGHTVFSVNLLLGHGHFTQEQLSSGVAIVENSRAVMPADTEKVKSFIPEFTTERRHTVLVVEDNNELRDFIVQSLQHTYHILEAENGKQGWLTAIEHVPDLIVSDVTMPEMDGFEFCLKVKKEEKTNHIPVIMLTAMAAQLHQLDGLEAGADVYITKPFSIQVLELSIRNLLQGREELRQKYVRQIMLHPRKPEMASPEEKFLDKLMQLMENRMEDPEFNVGNLVDLIGMSQTVLYKKVKALTGLTISDFIKSQRLKRAAQLLDDQQIGIAEVAYSVGFNDRKYFSKEFRKQFGLTPSEYQQKQNNYPI